MQSDQQGYLLDLVLEPDLADPGPQPLERATGSRHCLTNLSLASLVVQKNLGLANHQQAAA